MLNAEDCFANIHHFLLGEKVGKLAIGRKLNKQTAVKAFKKLTDKRKQIEPTKNIGLKTYVLSIFVKLLYNLSF